MGIRGRDSFVRVCGLVLAGILLAAEILRAQPSAAFLDLLPALAEKIATTAAAGTRVALSTVPPGADEAAARDVEREISRLLSSRGISVVPGGSAAAVVIAIGCGANLRERACIAEIRRGEMRDIVSSVKPHDARPSDDGGIALRTVAIEATPLFAQRAQILDVLPLDDRLFVLDPVAVTLYRRAGDDWQRLESRAIEPARTWPRDVRGRLRLTESTLEAFLPGVICRTSPELPNLACADQREPWPLAIDNAGLDALRNTFQTPEGTPFFSAAALDPSAGARSAVVTLAHALVLMDESRTPIVTVGRADDVVSIAAGCGIGAYILTASGPPGARTETLHVLRVEARMAVGTGTPIVLPGRVTALWSWPGAAVATAVVRDPNIERHEAFQIRLSCDR